MLLHPLDIFVLVAYFVSLFAIGLFFARKQTSREMYFLGGRRIPWFIAGASVFASLLSTISYLAIPGEMLRYGVGQFTHLFAFVLVIPVVNYFIIPTLMSLPDTSVYDYLGRRFSPSARMLGAGVFVVMRLIWMGLILYTGCLAISQMTGWSIPVLVLLMGCVTILYTTLGGMSAVVWSDFMQFIVLFGGAILIPVYIAWSTDSSPTDWLALFSRAERTHVPVFSFDPTERITVVGTMISLFVWNVCTHSADQVAAQRYMSTASLAEARRSFGVFSIANVVLTLLLMLCAVGLFYFEYQQSEVPIDEFQRNIAQHADDVFPTFIAAQLPMGLSGLLLAAILAAAMSSLSSGSNSIAAVLSTAGPSSSPRKGRELGGRPFILTSVAGCIGMGIAIVINYFMQVHNWGLVTLMERINHLFVAPLGALMLSGILFRHVNTIAVFLGFSCGLAVSLMISFSNPLFDYEISFMWIMPAAFATSLTVSYVVASLFPSSKSSASR